jgi:hypothetical protein
MTKNFQKLNAELGVEFDRYVFEHPAWARKYISPGAKVALQIDGNPAFNSWSRRLAERTRTSNQPIVFICIKKLASVRSRIVKAEIQKAA